MSIEISGVEQQSSFSICDGAVADCDGYVASMSGSSDYHRWVWREVAQVIEGPVAA